MKKLILFSLSLFLLTVVSNQDASARTTSSKKETKVTVQPTSSKTTVKAPTTSSKKTTVTYTPVKHNGVSYYVNGSKYYKKVNSRYVLVTPPIGLRVSILPALYSLLTYNNRNYYYSDGVVYQQYNNEYTVVKPEEGMVIPALPDVNVREVVIDGMIYFEFDGVLYKQIPTTSGLQYQVIGNLYE